MTTRRNDILANFARTFEQVVGDTIRAEESALIGNPVDGEVWYDETKMIAYIHSLSSGDAQSSVTLAQCSADIPKAEYKFKLPVRVKPINGRYEVTGKDGAAAVEYESSISPVKGETALDIGSINHGTIHTVDGELQVLVSAARYDGIRIGAQYSADFTASPTDTDGNTITRPTAANKAIAVLIQRNATDGTLSYKQSAQFSSSLSLDIADQQGLLPSADSDKYEAGYVKLLKGATEFREVHIYQAQPWFVKSAGGGFPIEITTTYTVATNVQHVTGNFTVGTGGSLTVNGRITVI